MYMHGMNAKQIKRDSEKNARAQVTQYLNGGETSKRPRDRPIATAAHTKQRQRQGKKCMGCFWAF